MTGTQIRQFGAVKAGLNYRTPERCAEEPEAALYLSMTTRLSGVQGYGSISLDDAKGLRDHLSALIEAVENVEPEFYPEVGTVIESKMTGARFIRVGENKWYEEGSGDFWPDSMLIPPNNDPDYYKVIR
jgi:hypothetical protein